MPTWGEIFKEFVAEDAAIKKATPPRQLGDASAFDIVRRKYLKALAAHTGRNTVLYATKWSTTGGLPAGPDLTSINAEDMQGFMEAFHGLSGEKLDLILHSPGGSPEAAEAIVKYVRSKFTDVRVIIPHAAMSAATMIACSANRIVMGKHSFIGPIDPQLLIPIEGVRSSMAAQAIIDQFRMAQAECFKDPRNMPAWAPILKQYGPALVVTCQNLITMSKDLVEDWLKRYMFANDPDAAKKAEAIANKLGEHRNHNSHNRFLSQSDAIAMGFVVDALEADDALQDLVLSVFHATTHCFGATGAAKIIENHLGKAFVKQQAQMLMPQMMPQPMVLKRNPSQPPMAVPPPGPPGGPPTTA